LIERRIEYLRLVLEELVDHIGVLNIIENFSCKVDH